jgi:hypothetical protein
MTSPIGERAKAARKENAAAAAVATAERQTLSASVAAAAAAVDSGIPAAAAVAAVRPPVAAPDTSAQDAEFQKIKNALVSMDYDADSTDASIRIGLAMTAALGKAALADLDSEDRPKLLADKIVTGCNLSRELLVKVADRINRNAKLIVEAMAQENSPMPGRFTVQEWAASLLGHKEATAEVKARRRKAADEYTAAQKK